ncbi:MAG: AAA family ATPase [Malacoplasma sp.]
MFETYFGMKCNPFKKDIITKDTFELADFKEAQARLDYLVKTKGIGLFTGTSGLGKTYSIKYYTKNLNPSLYKVVYLCLSTLTVNDFYKDICIGLGIEPKFRKVDMFHQIQDTIINFTQNRKITPVIVLDEAQYLSTGILNDIKLLFNFDMDSKDMAVLVLVGQPILNSTLTRNVHEALAQRIIINYSFKGLTLEETKAYIADRLKLCAINENIFEDAAIQAISSNANGSTRKLNSLIQNCLLLCATKKENIITKEIVMLATNDLSLI